MAKESEVVKEIHSLDSDMQTLVYENYNKFISATDTINKMRVDFRETVSEKAATTNAGALYHIVCTNFPLRTKNNWNAILAFWMSLQKKI